MYLYSGTLQQELQIGADDVEAFVIVMETNEQLILNLTSVFSLFLLFINAH